MKNENKNVVIGVLFCASLIVLIYTMLELRHIFLVVLGASACFLIMTGIMIQQVSIAFKVYQKKQTMLLESRLTELQNQLSVMNEDSQDAAKTNGFYIKKIGEALAGFEDELLENQRRGNALMKRVITTQAKSTKVLVKYNEINTNKVVSNVHNQYQQIEQSLDSTINSTNAELRKIGDNIMLIQRIPQTVISQPMPEVTSEMAVQEAPAMSQAEASVAEIPIEQTVESMEEAPVELVEEMPVEEAKAEPAVEMPADENAKLDADQIAALFAATEAPVAEAEPVEEVKAEPAVEMPADENAKLDADQIAALFAATEAPAAEAEPVEEVKAEPAVEMPADENAQLSPDQIAALFASANG